MQSLLSLFSYYILSYTSSVVSCNEMDGGQIRLVQLCILHLKIVGMAKVMKPNLHDVLVKLLVYRYNLYL